METYGYEWNGYGLDTENKPNKNNNTLNWVQSLKKSDHVWCDTSHIVGITTT